MDLNSPQQSNTKSLKPHQVALLTASAVSIVLMWIPFAREVLLPITYLNTFIHEFWHAFAATITGGQASYIKVFRNGEGVTFTRDGVEILICSAGYLGAALTGAAMIYFGRTPEKAKAALLAMGTLLLGSMLIWVRGDAIGVIAGLLWLPILFGCALKLKNSALLFACQFLGVQQCLNSLNSIYDLVQITASSNRESDALILEHITKVPAMLWALAWSLCGLALVISAVRKAWSQ